MARKPIRRRSSRPAPVMMAWEEWHEGLFRLAANDWTRPAQIRLQRTQRGGTYSANFVAPDGLTWRLAVRVAWATQTTVRVVDERMTVAFRTTLGGRDGRL